MAIADQIKLQSSKKSMKITVSTRTGTHRRKPLGDNVLAIAQPKGHLNPALPGIRMINYNLGFMVCELPPCRKTLTLRACTGAEEYDDYDDEDDHDYDGPAVEAVSYNVTLPWQVFIMTFYDNGAIGPTATFWRRSRLRGLDSALGTAMIYNRDYNGLMCMPVYTVSGDSAVDKAADVIESFYSSTFNYDHEPEYYKFSHEYRDARDTYGAQYPEAFGINPDDHDNLSFLTKDLPLETVARSYWPPDGHVRLSEPNAKGLDAHGEFTFGKYLPLKTALENLYAQGVSSVSNNVAFNRLYNKIARNSAWDR